MTARRLLALAAALTLPACGGPAETPTPVATELAHVLPAVNPVTYTSVDTARVDIEIGPGQVMEQTMGQSSTVRLRFAPIAGTPGNLSVTANYLSFTGFAESTMMPRSDIAETIVGDFVMSVTPEGEVDQISGPELPPAVEELSMGDNMFARFFMRLPNEIVGPGSTWTDTVHIEDDSEGARMSNESIVVSTFRGDTTVSGRRLWIVESTSSTNVLVEGEMQGMAMRNELSGTITETSLWDPARRLLHSAVARGTMNGTVSIPSAGMGDIPITVTNTRHLRLVESGS